MKYASQRTTLKLEKGVQLHTLLIPICFIHKPTAANGNDQYNKPQ